MHANLYAKVKIGDDGERQVLTQTCHWDDRPVWVSGGNYTSNHSTGSFCTHTGPSVFILANFGSRPLADVG